MRLSRNWARLGVAAAGTAVAVFTIVALNRLNQLADEHRQVASTMALVEAQAQHINALEWEAIAEGKADSGAIQEMAEARSALLKTVTELREQYPEAAALDRFYQLYPEYVRAVDEEIRLLQAGDFAQAREVDEQRVDPLFGGLLETITEARSQYGNLARAAVQRTERWMLLVVLGSVLSLLALFWMYERTHHRAQLAAAQQQALRASEERFRALTENSSDLIAVVDGEYRLRYLSHSGARILGYNRDSLVGSSLLDQVHLDDAPLLRAALENSRAGSPSDPVEFRMRKRDGGWVYTESGIRNLLADPKVAGLVLNVRDISERKQVEEQLVHNAFHDALTKLPNRALFLDRVNTALRRVQRHPPLMVAVLFIDLDDFKVVNDSLGHEAGDQLLLEVGRRLQAALRPSDIVARPAEEGAPADTLARLGGDEFTILLEDISDPTDALRVADRIQPALSAAFLLHGREVHKSASIGIALGGGEISPEELIRNADIAMYRAKKLGRARSEMFDKHMHAQVLRRLTMEADLRRALEQNEFRLHYQPIVTMATSEVVGLEALLRWERPGVGLLYPADFLMVAEETGLIRSIGDWVLKKACMRLVHWQRENPREPPIYMTVNISSNQFKAPGFAENVADVLRLSGIDPKTLYLEVTENVAMEDAEHTRQVLARLKALGVRLILDDFGTGYSSLSYLRRFDVTALKIDRSFVSHIDGNQENQAIVAAIIALARALRIEVVAEGTERTEEIEELMRSGCSFAQGYYFSHPVDANTAAELLTKGSVTSGAKGRALSP